MGHETGWPGRYYPSVPLRDPEVVGYHLMRLVEDICEAATPEQFVSRLELSALFRGYLLRVFAERYPDEVRGLGPSEPVRWAGWRLGLRAIEGKRDRGNRRREQDQSHHDKPPASHTPPGTHVGRRHRLLRDNGARCACLLLFRTHLAGPDGQHGAKGRPGLRVTSAADYTIFAHAAQYGLPPSTIASAPTRSPQPTHCSTRSGRARNASQRASAAALALTSSRFFSAL